MKDEVSFDFERRARIGLSEAVLCEGKSLAQIEHIIALACEREAPLLLTRLGDDIFARLAPAHRGHLDFDPVSRTAIAGYRSPAGTAVHVAVVAAGSSDVPVAREASRTLAFHGEPADEIIDVGVAGLWRIMERQEQLHRYRAVIVVAGMDGALFSVIGGLVGGVVIAVPTATGYGASRKGATALNAALASCAPGVVVVNVGNGFGAACAALRVLRAAGHGTALA
jgi:pyridinium-3,5-biscarboxylic acid mononucleotide synthase